MKLNNIFIIEANWGAIKPEYLYHCTSEKFLPFIMRGGLPEAKSGRGIYLCKDIATARSFATANNYYDLDDPIMIQIDCKYIDFDKLKPDPAMVGAHVKKYAMGDPMELEKYKMYKNEAPWYFGLMISNCDLYYGTVPLKAIKVL